MTMHVEQLFIYPVKSLHGIKVDAAQLCETGFQHDRLYMFALTQPDAPAKFLTQRELARLVLVIPRIDSEELVLAFDGIEQRLPLRLPASLRTSLPKMEVTIWKQTIAALDATSLFDQKKLQRLASFIQVPHSQLAFLAAADLRHVKRNAPTAAQIGREPMCGFADYYPVHLLQRSSFQDLAQRVPSTTGPIAIERFRMNVVVAGGAAFDEDTWKEVCVGTNAKWYIACRNVRCSVPDVNPSTGEKDAHGGVYKTMQTYRRVDPGAKYQPCLGTNAVPLSLHGQVAIGDEIKVLARGEHVYIPI